MDDHRKPHVMVLGLRGIPGVQGGIETHCAQLFPLLAEAGFEVTILGRSPYLPADCPSVWRGVRIVRLWSPRSKWLETLLHSFLGVLYAGMARPDLLHIHGVGPALWAPLARCLGLRVVMTHHGPDYDRQKWGRAAKLILRAGEAAGVLFSNRRIVISRTIQGLVRRKYHRPSTLVPNGVSLPPMAEGRATLEKFGLTARRYVLLVSRLVPEKRHLDLIEAFAMAGLPGWRLVLVGGSDHPDPYSQQVERTASSRSQIVMTGIQTGRALQELYSNAGLFVLPSSHEGLPIALLEALSFGIPSIASDIPANLEVDLPADHYFPLGDKAALAQRLKSLSAQEATPRDRRRLQEWVGKKYDWSAIAAATKHVYSGVLASE